MGTVIELKWIPPEDSSGYRAATADEAAHDAAVEVLDNPRHCTPEELAIAGKVMAATRCGGVRPSSDGSVMLAKHVGGAAAISAKEMRLLYAAAKRLWETPALHEGLKRALHRVEVQLGRRVSAAEVCAVGAMHDGVTPDPTKHRDEVVRAWDHLRQLGVTIDDSPFSPEECLGWAEKLPSPRTSKDAESGEAAPAY